MRSLRGAENKIRRDEKIVKIEKFDEISLKVQMPIK